MEKKEIIELVKYRNFLNNALTEEVKELYLAEQDPLFTPTREIRTQRIKDFREMLKEVEDRFIETGTFNADLFTTFMAKFLTITEDERMKAKFKSSDGKSLYVICSPFTLGFLRNSIKTNKDLEKFVNGDATEDVTKIKGEVVYPFDKNLNMKEKYASHYRLKYAIYELMQLKVDHPELSEEERYNIVLNNTLRRNKIMNQKKGSK